MKHLLPAMLLLSGFCVLPAAYAADPAEAAFVRPSHFSVESAAWNSPAPVEGYVAMKNREALRSWKRSLVPFAATQALDIVSSYGMRELNPLLAGPDGRFGGKAAGIKIGTAAAVLSVEYLIVKKWPGSARVFSKLNWGSSALTGAFAAHNFSIR